MLNEKRLYLGFWKEFVFFNRSGHCDLSFRSAILYAYDLSLALHTNAFRECDLGRKGESEPDRCALSNGGIYIEANSAGTHVPKLNVLGWMVSVCSDSVDGYRYAQGEPPCPPFFGLGL